MSLGRNRSGVPSLTSKVGSISTKHTFLSNFLFSINFKGASFTSMVQDKNIKFGVAMYSLPCIVIRVNKHIKIGFK
jgi:hypothetical protein